MTMSLVIVGNGIIFFADGDMFKLGFNGRGMFVFPGRDLVIAYFSTNPDEAPG